MANLSWIAIIAAAAAGFVVGGIWYGPLFGKAWMAEHGCTEEELKEMRPFREVFPDLAASIDRKLGRPKAENPKKAISLRLDAEVIERFKATGDGWQSRMNEALRKAVGL